MSNPLAVATPEPRPAGADHVLAASLFDMPDLAEPMLRLAGWLLLAVHGIARMARGRPPRRAPGPDREP